ncbi:Ca2 /H antiporter VCX1 and related proteins [Phaffia rhodozyma]|uniref:Ca2 /H antiporter VCX1 and related proteins n=1 Tax=Phaffia rhodozyma TaxID=264483 RepID=A0A0F7SFE1_PHARH|nr:Ca2 /H antiporter VCX1 and related proteins [Phaffia rhodozyma]
MGDSASPIRREFPAIKSNTTSVNQQVPGSATTNPPSAFGFSQLDHPSYAAAVGNQANPFTETTPHRRSASRQPSTTRQRSSSRSRPLPGSSGPLGLPSFRRVLKLTTDDDDDTSNGDDDELHVPDRGEKLVRRRMKERRQLLSYSGQAAAGSITPGLNSSSNQVDGASPTMPSFVLGSKKQARGRDFSRGQTPGINSRKDDGGYFAGFDQPSFLDRPSSTRPTSPLLSIPPRMPSTRPRAESLRSARGKSVSVEGSERGSIRRQAPPDDPDNEDGEYGDELGELASSGILPVRDIDGDSGDEDLLDDGQDQVEDHNPEDDEGEDDDADDDGEVELTLRDRQDAINIEHPFGLPIWKPALYRKSRTVTRQAETALHAIPSAAAQRHLLPGNIAWTVLFGWWLSLVCFIGAGLIWLSEGGGGRFSALVWGLGWYIFWPFGKYVEGEGKIGADDEGDEEEVENDEEGMEVEVDGRNGVPNGRGVPGSESERSDSSRTIKAFGTGHTTDDESDDAESARSLNPIPRPIAHETDALLGETTQHNGSTFPSDVNTVTHAKSAYGSISPSGRYKLPDSSLSADFINGTETVLTFGHRLGQITYWLVFCLIIAPLLALVCVLCWGFVFSIPMAKLLWALLEFLYSRPLELGFKPAPKIPVVDPEIAAAATEANGNSAIDGSALGSWKKRARLRPGQVAPTGGPRSTVLLCTYKAVGTQYYKYTIGGVNILFVNLVPLVFFVIADAFVLLPLTEKQNMGPFLNFLAAREVIFLLAISSVIPLSYFIGMAVASISAQSSIGMGAVINATFGSIIELILYSIALVQGKGRLVEGSIVGSLLAGVLLMPGVSMCAGAFKRKEQKFNAKSAGVTSTMLIMAIVGTLIPTVFYQAFGTVELSCTGCSDDQISRIDPFPLKTPNKNAWGCQSCRYVHPDPAKDAFYQENVKNLMFICAGLLLFSYLVGLWFSLKTHASQIWQNPQQLLQAEATAAHYSGPASVHPAYRASVHNRLTPAAIANAAAAVDNNNAIGGKDVLPTTMPVNSSSAGSVKGQSSTTATQGLTTGRPGFSHPESKTTNKPYGFSGPARSVSPSPVHLAHSTQPRGPSHGYGYQSQGIGQGLSGSVHSIGSMSGSLTPFVEGIVIGSRASGEDKNGSDNTGGIPPMELPSSLASDEVFTRAVTAATVTALRHQQQIVNAAAAAAAANRPRPISHHTGIHGSAQGGGPGGPGTAEESHEGGGGHEGPSWSRTTSASVLLSCTLLYAIIAEILVDVVDVVLEGSGLDEKFLGITLFTLVPNVTEFMNAISFALGGNIALSMEIGSAYALQVCLLQIPAMVAFSAFYDPKQMGEFVDTFTLIFPQYDCICIIFSIFLLTYTYIEARSNYHRGSILILVYLALLSGFYYAPHQDVDNTSWATVFSAGDVTRPMFRLSRTEDILARFRGLWA